MTALGKDRLDIVTLNEKCQSTFNKLVSSMEKLRQQWAQMPTPKAIDRQNYFGTPLEC
ncbi:dennd4b protein [Lynx pardinus]|uniref:Dennd4b protein n=1 Tax=Lynx pardinus TaxID=191816 RepID=A0A485NAT5_LYNPA|nr:dennd4b protein [Lynx pardinus]